MQQGWKVTFLQFSQIDTKNMQSSAFLREKEIYRHLPIYFYY